ncbi:MAG: hypothetical protein EOP47_08345 [Sphingobacteriaceae bacterium]|nr:MAG: hypothetical protein EOP47_08345 [Sphingobacteriaceae bacterium]
MKKRLITLVAILSTIASYAQTHLAFKGVPIDGKLSEYILRMKQNGFTQMEAPVGGAIFKGDFASYKDCKVVVSTLKDKDLVSKITVTFPVQESWSALSSNYFNLKEMLTEKYGQPSESIENFSSREPRDDGAKMTYVHLDYCKYITTYKTDKGSIQLSIKNAPLGAYVTLAYIDKINGDIIRAKAKEDL